MSLKLIMLTVDTTKDDDYLENATSASLTLKLRPFVPGETVEVVTLRATGITVLDLDKFLDLDP